MPGLIMGVMDGLRHDEALRLKPYRDTTGNLTIGYGLNLDDGITKDEAEMLLSVRVSRAVSDSRRVFGSLMDALPASRQGVIVNMLYNLGLTRFLKFEKFVAAVKAGDTEAAANEMIDSLWYRQTGYRAKRLVEQWRQG